jgi:hypothetical protein
VIGGHGLQEAGEDGYRGVGARALQTEARAFGGLLKDEGRLVAVPVWLQGFEERGL